MLDDDDKRSNNLEAVKHKISLSRSYTDDLLEKYKIDTNSPIQRLHTEFAKYYSAKHQDSTEEFFAVVCELNFQPSIDLLEQLKHKAPSESCVKLYTYGLVRMSVDNKYHMVVIIESYDYQKTLAQHFETRGSGLDVYTIIHTLLPTILQVIHFCDQNKLNCGVLHPKNILMIENNQFCIREFFASPPHFFQDKMFLAPEISDCSPYAMTTWNVSADIYALGMLLYSSFIGTTKTLEDVSNNTFYNAIRLEEGSYQILTTMQHRIPLALSGVLKNTLNNIEERWKAHELSHFILGKNIPTRRLKNAPTHSVPFSNKNYTKITALISAMYNAWGEATTFVAGESFYKWITKQINNDTSDDAAVILTLISNKKGTSNFQGIHEYLIKIMVAIDGKSTIRTNTFCITIESIASIMCHALIAHKNSLLESIIGIVTKKWWQKTVISFKNTDNITIEYLQRITTLTNVYQDNLNSASCGIERLVYTLNPYLPCQSPLVVNDYVITLHDLLSSLNNAIGRNIDHTVIDRHIIAFLSSRLDNIQRERDIYIQRDAETLSQTLTAQGLLLLSRAQELNPNIQINHIVTFIEKRLIELIEKHLHNVKLIEIISNRITEAARDTNLSQIVSIISNTRIFQNDKMGYKKACLDVATLNKKIVSLNDTQMLKEYGTLLGQRITVFTSYILFMFVTLILVM